MIKTQLYNRLLNYNFEKLFEQKGYAYFTLGEYNLNIIGVRSNNKKRITNLYDDYIVVIYNTPTMSKRAIYAVTTEPGLYYMLNPLKDSKGTAILMPGQYRGCWQLALHKGKYKALCQRKPVKVYRDGNKDDVYDMLPETIDKGIFGINIHRSHPFYDSPKVDKYSAGCQVFQSPSAFNSFIRICEEQRARFGNSFTYTLVDETELNEIY
jgi:hypothetical protein